MSSLRPRLVVRGADAAIDFYVTALGATLESRHTVGGQVVHAQLSVLGGAITLKEEDDHDPAPTTLGRPGVLLEVVTDEPDRLAAAVVGAGGSVIFAVADQPYGARGGRVRDPFGHEWLLQTEATMTNAEMQAALDLA